MSEKRVIRLNKVLGELNISLDRAVDHLKANGFAIESSPNAKISDEEYSALNKQFSADKGKKEASIGVSEEKRKEKEALRLEREREVLEEKRKKESWFTKILSDFIKDDSGIDDETFIGKK